MSPGQDGGCPRLLLLVVQVFHGPLGVDPQPVNHLLRWTMALHQFRGIHEDVAAPGQGQLG